VGLGGRLDSTNVILPELSVITQIGLDHTNLLGNTVPLIAFEKAGIIKKNVPVVIGERQPGTFSVFEKAAAAAGASLTYADERRMAADWKFEGHALVAEVTSLPSGDKDFFQLDLTGIYQLKNLLTVLEAVHVLSGMGWDLDRLHVHEALRQVKKLTGLHGRWEQLRQHPSIVLDVAHNEDGMRQLVRQIELTDHEELHIVLGIVKDKEIGKLLELLPKQARYYFTRAQIPRALPEDQLAEQAAEKGLTGQAYPSVMEAVNAARGQARPRDLVIVCGSVFVVGEVELAG
jgi:dihydrofolate synthase / folylpolyglutamate synthase